MAASLRYVLLFVALIVTAAGGCSPDYRRPCTDMYEHLTTMAQRRVDAKVRREFVSLCTETWDDLRTACLLLARTPKEALRCKPSKVHPS